MFTKVSGSWRKAKKVYTKVGGTWRPAKAVYTKVGGVWRKGWTAWAFTNTINVGVRNHYGELFLGYNSLSSSFGGRFGSMSPNTVDGYTIQHIVAEDLNSPAATNQIRLSSSPAGNKVIIELSEGGTRYEFTKLQSGSLFFNLSTNNAADFREMMRDFLEDSLQFRMWIE